MGEALVYVRESHCQSEGPERLLVHGSRLRIDADEQRRLPEKASRVIAWGTSRGHVRAAGDRIFDHGSDAWRSTFVRERAEGGLRIEAIAHPQLFDRLGEGVGEPGVDALLHKEAGRRDADLPGIAELRPEGHAGYLRDVGVIEDEHRGMAAELESYSLDPFGCETSD